MLVICSVTDTLSTPTIMEPPSVECQDLFNSSQINACIMGIGVLGPRFIVSSEGLGLHKMFPLRGFKPSTSRMPGKHRTPKPMTPPFGRIPSLKKDSIFPNIIYGYVSEMGNALGGLLGGKEGKDGEATVGTEVNIPHSLFYYSLFVKAAFSCVYLNYSI